MMRSVKIWPAAAVLALGLTLLFQLPVLAEQRDFRTRVSEKLAGEGVSTADIAAEISFGREVAAHILGRYKLDRDDRLNRYINLVGRGVALHSNRSDLDFRFAVLASSTINAYAAPGGYIFVTRGAIANMADEAELAAVLAHEIAHVAERHIVRELGIRGEGGSAQAGLAHLIGAIGDPTRVAFKQAVDQALDILFKQGYSRRDEAEADQNGLILLTATGYDPAGLRRYLAKLEESGAAELEIHNRTHPPSAERLAALDLVISETGLDKIAGPSLKERFNEQTR
ncbi:MAG: M48 family metalloprotease [Desulfurivibrionaceae bacterium]|nr:M48 family metalloprotease [Desulfurivibrionaceae bacterium]